MLRYFKICFLSLWAMQMSIGYAQEIDCTTPSTGVDLLRGIDIHAAGRADHHYTVRIFVHIINDTDGTGGIDTATIYQELRVMEEDFAPHNICFALVGIDTINDSFFTENLGDDWDELRGEELIEINAHSNAIDIYIVPEATGHSGSAYNIPSTNFTMGADRIGLRTMSHEMGHCLNLYHTHETFGGRKRELVDRSNCATAGDFLCDTPADPNVSRSMDRNTCTYTGRFTDDNGDTYVPDPSIIMSYGRDCRNHFTNGQGRRMRAHLNSVGDDVVVDKDHLSLHSTLALSGERLEVANHSITAGDLYGSSSKEYAVGLNAYVTHTAKNEINLKPGFVAEPGINGEYLASIRNYMCHEASSSELAGSGEASHYLTDETVSLNEKKASGRLELSSFPNPFSNTTTIEFQLSKSSTVSIDIRNPVGQIVAKPLHNEQKHEGMHQIKFDGNHLPSGVYLCVLHANGQQKTQRLVLHK